MGTKGEITFPGDKSISHRSLMFAALADGESRISNLSTGTDVQSTRECLEACGIAAQCRAGPEKEASGSARPWGLTNVRATL